MCMFIDASSKHITAGYINNIICHIHKILSKS